MLICIEGPDGCGKDTVANAVAESMGASRLNFPNDQGVTGPMIRAYLRKEWHVSNAHGLVPGHFLYREGIDKASALAFQALQVANRMESMVRLNAAVTGDTDLVLARYWQSAWVYGQLDGLDPDWLVRLHEAMARPQINVLLDVPAETCMARRAARDGAATPELYEGRLDFTRRVVDLYRKLWRQNLVGDEGDGPWHIVDADRDVGLVIADVIELALEVRGGS